MNTKKVYILEDRGILYINGPDSEKFLQNLISNDIEKVNEKKVVLPLYFHLRESFYLIL